MDTPDPRLWLKQLPNKLTLVRVAATPVLLLLYPLDFTVTNIFCALLFLFAALTDWLDGYLARKYDSVTALGALLDPIADKMLIAAALVVVAGAGHAPVLLCGLMIARDIGVSGMRLIAQEKGAAIEVNAFGKTKTAVQIVALFCLLLNKPLWDLPFRTVGMLALWASLVLSLYSAWLYGQAFWAKTKSQF